MRTDRCSGRHQMSQYYGGIFPPHPTHREQNDTYFWKHNLPLW